MHWSGKDTVDVVVLDVHECDFVVDHNRGRRSLVLRIEHKREELINHGLVDVTTVIPTDENLVAIQQ